MKANLLFSIFLSFILCSFPELYAQDRNRIYRSEDGGQTWQPSAEGFPQNVTVTDFLDEGSCILAATNDDGLYVSSDNGHSWKATGAGLPSNVTSLVKHNNLLFAAAWRAGVYVSRDHGKHWQESNFGLTDLEVNAFLSMGNDLFLGTSTGIFYSWNNGKTWMKLLSVAHINGLMQVGNSICAVGAKGVFRSEDRGKNWQQVLSNSGIGQVYASDYGLFATTYREGLLRSLDNGQLWELAENGLPELGRRTFSFTQATDRLIIGQVDGIYYSTTHGLHWIKQDGPFNEESWVRKLYTLPNGTLLAGVVFRQGDGC